MGLLPLEHTARRLAVGAWLFVAGVAHAGEYAGAEFAQIATQSLNALAMHQQVSLNQLQLDSPVTYFELTTRSSPATFLLNDGQSVGGGLTRMGLGFGVGGGRPSKVSAFASFQGDYAMVTQFPLAFVRHPTVEAGTVQAVITGGLAVRGIQLSGGAFLDGGFGGLDAQGRFAAAGTDEPAYRAGTPADVIAAGVSPYNEPRISPIFTLTSAEGFTSGATIGQVVGEAGGAFLAGLRNQLTPAKLMDRLELDELGVPLAGLDLLDGRTDYWGDARREAVEEAPPGEIPGYELPADTRDTVQWTMGWDDVLVSGVRVRTITQIRPTPLFRLAELAWLERFSRGEGRAVVTGARAVLFRRGSAYEPSADAFVALGGSTGEKLGQQAWWTASYSYNSPESSTFFPIPDAHVLGLQVVLGPVGVARPLIPIMPRLAEVEAP